MDRNKLALLIGAAAAVYLAYIYRPHAPAVTLSAQAFGQSWTPYSWYEHHTPGITLRHYPQSVGATVLPRTIQNESAGLAMECLEVDSASYPQ